MFYFRKKRLTNQPATMPATAYNYPYPPPATLVWERTVAANKSAIANQQSAIANHSHIVNRCSVFGVQNKSAIANHFPFVNRCSVFGVHSAPPPTAP